MTSMAEADCLYNLCRNYTVTYHHVEHELFKIFSERTSQFARSVGDREMDEPLESLLRLLRRYRFDLAASPVRFNDPSVMPRMGANELSQLVKTLTLTHPSLAGPARSLVETLSQLANLCDEPLVDAMVPVLSTARFDRAAVLLTENRLAQLARSTFQLLPHFRGVESITPDVLRRSSPYDLLVVIGPARWYPEHVFSAPRAKTIEVISYSWLRPRWQPSPSFLAPTVGLTVTQRPNQTDDQGHIDDITPELNWAWIERGLRDENPHEAGGEDHDLERLS